MGHFTVKAKTKLSELELGAEITESDFATMDESGNLVQLQYHEDDGEREPVIAKPGIFTMVKTPQGLVLEKTSFHNNNIMKEFVNCAEITDRAKNFFNRLHVYETYKVFPKRFLLLYGPPGTGKSTAIAEIANQFGENPEYFILVWHTDQIEAGDVKDFIKHLDFQGPTKMIIIMEDIGGVEAEGSRRGSESALLSLLDNQEKAFKIPTLGIGTTNYIDSFQSNLTNRPGRFDEKLQIGFPSSDARVKLLKHYDVQNIVCEEAYKKIASKACDQLTPAQLQELIIRSALNERNPLDVIDELIKDIKKYDKGFMDAKAGVKLMGD